MLRFAIAPHGAVVVYAVVVWLRQPAHKGVYAATTIQIGLRRTGTVFITGVIGADSGTAGRAEGRPGAIGTLSSR